MATTTPLPPQRKTQKFRDGTCFGVIEEAADTARKNRMERTKPQPWIVRKLMVGFTLGLMGYAAFVYIQYLCLPMIQRKNNSQGSRGIGISLLAVFSVLYLWMVWAYLKVVLTSPGYARDHVSKVERPLLPASFPMRESWNSTPISHTTETNDYVSHDVEMGYRAPTPLRRVSLSPTTSRSHATVPITRKDTGLAGPSYEDLLRRDGALTSEVQGTNTGTLDTTPVPKPAFMGDSKTIPGAPVSTSPVPTSTTVMSHQQQQKPHPSFNVDSRLKLKKPKPLSPSLTLVSTKRQQKWIERERVLQSLNITRRPPTTAVLQPVHRYCNTDEILKPYRSHHCRVCGTCVLKYDHHCPWIGQCVGARNHKFFLNFCQATVFFSGYVFATLLAYTITGMDRPLDNVNPQEIVVIALGALFLFFTSMLVVTHINMILKGQTTVESVQIMNMKDRENRTLAKGFDCWEIGAKRRKQWEWDQEWGRLNAEGHIWWRGNLREHWIDVMGDWWPGWILPVGRSGGNGLSYPVNPRFDAEGRWRRRDEWPEDLR